MRTAPAVPLIVASLLSVGCAGHVAVVDHYQVPTEQLRAYLLYPIDRYRVHHQQQAKSVAGSQEKYPLREQDHHPY